MTITRWTNNQIQTPNAGEFEHVLEIALWSDCGITEYVGISNATRNDLIDLMNSEVARLHAWMDSEVASGAMGQRTDEPQIARILERPIADQDGEFPELHDWSEIFYTGIDFPPTTKNPISKP
jgi:hypothetical protein